jgi:hypothetical protein
MTNTAYNNENHQLELQGVGEPSGNSGLVEAHQIGKSPFIVSYGNKIV